MKNLMMIMTLSLLSANTFACSYSLVENFTSRIHVDYSSSIHQMQAAVAAIKVCSHSPEVLEYAAQRLGSRIRGDYSYSVRLSQELGKLCRNDSRCANAVVRAIGESIEGNYSYSVGMSNAIASVVRRNRFHSTKCAAMEAISNAIHPGYSYSRSMNSTIVEIANFSVKMD